MTFIRRIPLPTSALALALAALGNLLGGYSEALRLACGAVSAVLVLLVVLRIVTDYKAVVAECENCATLAVLPTLFMALMVLSTYLKPYAPGIAPWLWGVALGLQLAVTVLFVKRHLLAFDLAKVLPSWFIVFVGYVVASLTSPAFSMQPLGRILLYCGLVGYAAVLGTVVYRMTKLGDLPAPALPTVAIFAAPASLCLAGYLAVTETKQPAVVYALLAVSAVSLLFVLSRLPKVLRLDFHPGFAALTFPIVITAVALKQTNAFLAGSAAGSFIPPAAIVAMDALAALVVSYVLIRYAMLMAAPVRS
ncbi:TDT family transporter [bacterium]|nr:TDT family transporter [bacterium]